MITNRDPRRRTICTLFLLLLFISAMAGCHSPHASVKQPSTATDDVRNNSVSLLYDLLGDEQNVSKLLIIKRDREELHRVIKRISTNAAAGRKTLERMAADDASLDLKKMALPSGEKATREAIGKTKTGELLRASGADFEFKLLLTQTEALNYGEHLAKVAAANEPKAEHAKIFREISTEMKRRSDEVRALMRSGTVRGQSVR